MCYYVSQKTNHSLTFNDITRESELLKRPVVGGFGGMPIGVMKRDGSGSFNIVGMDWGFIPSYMNNAEEAKKFKFMYTTLNATSEALFVNAKGKKSLFADAVRERRCLVPVTGYYEWRHITKYHKKTGEPLKGVDKYPYFIRVKGMEVFYLAGIWNEWTDRETGEVHESLAFTTTEANEIAAQIHNSKLRMPTMLNTELAKSWMFDTLTDDDITAFAKIQFPADEMEAWTVDKKYLESLDPTCPVVYDELPALRYPGDPPITETIDGTPLLNLNFTDKPTSNPSDNNLSLF